MFSGIVAGVARIEAIDEKINFRTFWVSLPESVRLGLKIGDSVAHNGCCLTVTQIDGGRSVLI